MNRQVLIIDDDRAVHDLVSAQLNCGHTECISAIDGFDGLQKAIDVKPDAILLDMDMPQMSGIEVCRRLKSNPVTRNIPVVFLTGDRAVGSKVQGIDIGAVDYVTKPFDAHELRARVRSALRTADAFEAADARAGIDEPTGIWNRAYLVKQVETMTAAAERSVQLVSCCFIAIDQFDELAQKMGQPGGADLIRDAAQVISDAVRLQDIVCRYDTGIIAVLGLVSDRKICRSLAERIRSEVGQIGLRSFIEPESVTCSVGAVTSRYSVGPAILGTAERALSEAKQDGNRIVFVNADSMGPGCGDALAN